jgi:hypothetical protein
MKTASMVVTALATLTLAGAVHAEGPVCNAQGTYAQKVAEGRDLGITEEQTRQRIKDADAKITVGDKPDRTETFAVIHMVYTEPRVAHSDPINAKILAVQQCVKRHGPKW